MRVTAAVDQKLLPFRDKLPAHLFCQHDGRLLFFVKFGKRLLLRNCIQPVSNAFWISGFEARKAEEKSVVLR